MVSKSSASLPCPTFDFQPDSAIYHAKNAFSLAQVCSFTYKNDLEVKTQVNQVWGCPNYRFFNSERTNTQGFVMGNHQVIVLAFRGTKEPQDWLTNLKITQTEHCHGLVHEGFWEALDSVWNEILDTIQHFRDNQQPIFVTGHSLGGALATLAVARLLDAPETKDWVRSLYTFGSPRVGNTAFTEWFDRQFRDSTFRLVYSFDIVTQIALKKVPGLPEYDHVGLIYYFDRSGRLINQILAWKCFKLGFRLRVKAEMAMEHLKVKAKQPLMLAPAPNPQPEDADFQIPWRAVVQHLLTNIKDHYLESYILCLEQHQQATPIAKIPKISITKIAAKIQQIPQTLRAIPPRST